MCIRDSSRVAQAVVADEETVERLLPGLRGELDDAGMPFELLRLGDRLQPVSYTHLDVYKRQPYADGRAERHERRQPRARGEVDLPLLRLSLIHI